MLTQFVKEKRFVFGNVVEGKCQENYGAIDATKNPIKVLEIS